MGLDKITPSTISALIIGLEASSPQCSMAAQRLIGLWNQLHNFISASKILLTIFFELLCGGIHDFHVVLVSHIQCNDLICVYIL